MTETLTLANLVVPRGGRDVVRDVTIEVTPGEVTALLGPNGAGKSSMVLAVGGVLPLKSGSVMLGDVNLAGRRPERIRRAGLAIVPEGRRLLPELTVEDNLKVATYSLSTSDAVAGRKRALEMFPELEKRLTNAARALSGGEQQMVVLAQALVSQPKYVIIDELSLGSGAGGGAASHSDDQVGDRIRHWGAADRAVRHRRARHVQPRLRDGGWADSVFRDRPGTAGEARAPALRLPAARAHRRRWRRTREPAGRGMSSGLGVSELEHVLVLTDDIDAARDFYEAALGLHAGDRPPFPFTGHWLYAGERPCLHIAGRSSYRRHSQTMGLEVGEHPGAPGSGPVDHIAFAAADYDAICDRLAAAGIEPVRNDIPGGGPRQLFFNDPDGLRVEINVRT